MDDTAANTFSQFVLVAAPSLFTLYWTFDAPLVPGADVFLVALLQTGAIAAYVVHHYRSVVDVETE